jgi:glycerol-3-phosphate dehydrogenase
MSDVIPEALGRPDHPTAFLSGPSFAKEVMERHPTTVVVASASEDLAVKVQKLFLSLDFRVYVSTDVVGVEVGGALKNVLAIASGIAQGMGFGSSLF